MSIGLRDGVYRPEHTKSLPARHATNLTVSVSVMESIAVQNKAVALAATNIVTIGRQIGHFS